MYVENAAKIAVNILRDTQAYDNRAIIMFAKEVLKLVGYYPVRVEKLPSGDADSEHGKFPAGYFTGVRSCKCLKKV